MSRITAQSIKFKNNQQLKKMTIINKLTMQISKLGPYMGPTLVKTFNIENLRKMHCGKIIFINKIEFI